jgi:hypothetical protein
VPIRVKKFHPALKHAGYSAVGLLPGENKAEFEKLHRDLIAEFAPDGVFEDDIVATMARLLWSKQNLETFRVAALARLRCNQIREEKIPGYKIEVPFLMLGAREEVDPAEREAATQAAEDQIRKELGETYELAEIGEAATVDCLMKDLDIQERLDALFDRCIKRLLMVRGLKSISSASSSAPQGRLARPSKVA